MTYGGYLGLDQLLSAQHPISSHHDELLFIILHQTKELWLKQTIHELELSRDLIRRDALVPVHKCLSRVSRIQAVMTLSWEVLSTLTPTDYTSFRHVLGSSSGFQSAQFRQVEFLLASRKRPSDRHEQGSAAHACARRVLSRPSLWMSQCGAFPRRLRCFRRRARARLGGPPPRRGGGDGLGRVYRDTRAILAALSARGETGRIDDGFATWLHKHSSPSSESRVTRNGARRGRLPHLFGEARFPRALVAAHQSLGY